LLLALPATTISLTRLCPGLAHWQGFDAVTCPKKLIKFTAAEGAGDHCEMMNLSLSQSGGPGPSRRDSRLIA
jgi:hypothetical protein